MKMMDKLSQLWRRLLFYARRDQFDRELEEEMRFHLEMKAEENLAGGASPEEARYAAQRRFGNQTLLQEVSRGIPAGHFRYRCGNHVANSPNPSGRAACVFFVFPKCVTRSARLRCLCKI